MFPKFFEYVKLHDMFFLFETHVVSENFDKYSRYFAGFELKWMGALKSSKYGRPSGGMLWGVRYNLIKNNNYCRFVEHEYLNVVKCNFLGKNIVFVPVYLNCNKWENEYDILYSFFRENFDENYEYVMIGDMNGRIGNKQPLSHDLNIDLGRYTVDRKTKDSKSNCRGDRLLALCDDFQMFVLNGRCTGDLNGEITFMGGPGSSVVDLCCATVGAMDRITRCEVGAEVFSDHMPLVISMISDYSSQGVAMQLLPRIPWQQKTRKEYAGVLSELVESRTWDHSRHEETVYSLVNIVREAAESSSTSNGGPPDARKPWWNWDCAKARRKSYALLNLHRSSNDSQIVREAYVQANSEYKSICRRREREFYSEVAIRFAAVRDVKEFWQLVGFVRGSKVRRMGDISLDQWADHFQAQWKLPLLVEIDAVQMEFCHRVDLIDKPFDMDELQAVLGGAKENKAPGIDRIPVEFYKFAPDNYLQRMLDLFNSMYDTGSVPQDFGTSIVFPLHKKGDINDVKCYRGLSFINSMAKILAGLLLGRLQSFVDSRNIMSEAQTGFRKGYSTVDAIFTLTNLVHLQFSKGPRKKVFAFFVDYRGAFDRVRHDLLFEKLDNMGVSQKFLKFLSAMYGIGRATVWGREGLSRYFDVEQGVKQGCLLSPLLFALFINDLTDALVCGVAVGSQVIPALLYADDVVVVAESREDLQRNIDALHGYCTRWSLEVNLEKSKIVVFRRGGRLAGQDKWYYGSNELDIVSSFRYLGVSLTPALSFTGHLRDKASASKTAINSIYRSFFKQNSIPINAKYKVFMAAVRTILTYAAQIWGYKYYGVVEQVQIQFVKMICSLPLNTPNYMVYLEADVDPVFFFTLALHCGYIKKVLKMPESRFPKIVALEAINKNTSWAKELRNLAGRVGCAFDLDVCNLRQCDSHLDSLLAACKVTHRDEIMVRALQSSNLLYSQLDLNVHPLDMKNERPEHPLYVRRWLVKLRGSLLGLNHRPFLPLADRREDCSMCNMRELEDVHHFLGVCPVLGEFRYACFGSWVLTRERVITILNGDCMGQMAKYCSVAWRYRAELVREFNW
uniref:RNA-directed DNA polymerase from mobile element jockey n=1 Tax=Lygus hesperus TaxID=30085 RepID=A0A146MDJ5_LYGHE